MSQMCLSPVGEWMVTKRCRFAFLHFWSSDKCDLRPVWLLKEKIRSSCGSLGASRYGCSWSFAGRLVWTVLFSHTHSSRLRPVLQVASLRVGDSPLTRPSPLPPLETELPACQSGAAAPLRISAEPTETSRPGSFGQPEVFLFYFCLRVFLY